MNRWFFFVFLAFILFTLGPLCWIYEYECNDAAVIVGADWTLHPWRHNSSNVGVSLRAMRDTTQLMLGVSLRARWDTTLVHIICHMYFRDPDHCYFADGGNGMSFNLFKNAASCADMIFQYNLWFSSATFNGLMDDKRKARNGNIIIQLR